jgi:monoamine oxidase
MERNSMRIAVVGAGISGLRTAQLLEAKGALVQVFEARDRVGGRLETVSLPSGGFYEAGGEWIDADHHRTAALLREFGMEPEKAEGWPGMVVCQGDFAKEDQLWPDAEEDAEALHQEAAEICSRLPEPAWASTDHQDLDLQTLDEFIQLQCLSPRGRWLASAVSRSDEGEDPDRVGLLGWLVGYRHYLNRSPGDMSLYRIPGGAGALCQRLAEAINGPIHLNRPLRSVELREDIVELWFDGEMAFFDRVVMTLPPAALLNVDFASAVPPEKEAAWGLMGSSRAIKVALAFDAPWWREGGASGRILSDLPCQQIWESGRNGAHVLCCYICGDGAEFILGSKDPVETCLKALNEICPEADDSFIEGWVHDWINDPWSLGAFSHLPPGSVMGALPHLKTPVERIHFAGEYTAEWLGFIEGALESAERAAAEAWNLS